jgi:hypothetical protein
MVFFASALADGNCIPPVYQFVVIYNSKFFPSPEILFTFADH